MKRLCTDVSSALVRLAALGALGAGLQAAITVSLNSSAPSLAPVATPVTWTAAASDSGPGPVRYRFRARMAGGVFRVIQDYSPAAAFTWTASKHDGPYEVEVTARDTSSGESAAALSEFDFTSRVSGGGPVISPTANPLVFLYSAPPCHVEARMRVEFQDPAGIVQDTPFQACSSGLSMNFYLAGLRPNTTYTAHHTIDTGVLLQDGPALTLTTPSVSVRLPAVTPIQPASSGGILLHSTLLGPPFATDLAGNLVWFYSSPLTFLTRADNGGFFYSLLLNANPSYTLLREFDLAGNTVRQTNAARINEQLAALGLHNIGAFHHEALGLPDGGVLVLASTERILNNVQGSGAVDILGDMILALDQDLQVKWAWDAFDHLDPHRAASLGETCSATTAGCPPLYLARQANDWLHGNALQLTSDGNILYSSRHQDWIVKIDYANGSGTGDVLWRLGPGGDFQMLSNDPNPWFSHQHGPQFAPGSHSILAVYDDGNLRQAADPTAHSRGQVLQLDEKNRTAALLLNADLGGFSFAVGSAQPLPDGNFFFGGGWLPDATCTALEFSPAGDPIYGVRVQAPEFRTFRMPDLYSAESSLAAAPRLVHCPLDLASRARECRANPVLLDRVVAGPR